MPRKNLTNKKWHTGDVAATICEIVLPLAAVLVVCFLPSVQALSDDIRLSIIGLGLVAPIVILQLSVNAGQNKIEHDVENLSAHTAVLDEEIQHISPMLEKVFVSGNDRIKRFVFHRAEEMNRIIKDALNTMNSGTLKVSEYYDELEYLAKLIIADKNENSGRNFKGEVWAMTSFAPDEWADEGLERIWTARLREIVEKGIPTRRLCIVPKSVQDIIESSTFSEPIPANTSYNGFYNILRDYYGTGTKKGTASHFCIKEGENRTLDEHKGFFAIKLTNGELHILTGETVNSEGALSAKVLFDPDEIKRVRELFERYMRADFAIDKFVTSSAKSNGFIAHLEKNGIKLSK